jgi:hypothetical protein
VGMANWPKRGFQCEFFEVLERYTPTPEGFPNPREWGEEDVVRKRFDGLAGSISTESRFLRWEFGSFAEMAQFFRSTAPRAAAVPEEHQEAVVSELGGIVDRWNSADDGSVRIDAEYTLVVARKRG